MEQWKWNYKQMRIRLAQHEFVLSTYIVLVWTLSKALELSFWMKVWCLRSVKDSSVTLFVRKDSTEMFVMHSADLESLINILKW